MSTLSKWLQPPPKGSLEQQYQELVNLLRTKEKALETTSHELKVKISAMQILEHKIMSAETMITSTQRELTARTEQMKVLEADLAARSNRVTALEAEANVARQRMTDLNLIITDQADELRGVQQACRAAEQAQEVLKEEIRVLREHIAQLNEGITDRNYLRSQVERLESAQGRAHQLEVELSDREAAHRGTLQQLERALAERDQRIKKADASTAAQADEVRVAQQACRASEQAQEVLKEEIRVLREHIAQLNEGLPARERLRAEVKDQVKELELMRSRVHQLEVELSDREAAHRGTLQQLERALAERDQRISEFDSLAAAQADEVRDTVETCRIAEQTREVQKEEIRILREQIAQLNEGLADRDRLRTQLKKLEAVQDRVKQLEVELSDREAAHRGTLLQLEQALTERDRRISKFDSQAATQAQALQGAQQACQAAEQTQEVLKEEIRVLREQIAHLNEGLADRDHVRARMEKLESAQDRVHQLEVELSDREAAHRGTLQQLERALAERDQRISEFDSLAAAQADEVRDTVETCRIAEQTREVQKEEIRILREQIAQLNEGLADRDRLRTQLKKLEAVQDRVKQLEVELSDREAAHRGTLLQLEQALTERDRRISKFDSQAATQAQALQGAQQACQAAEQTQEVLKEEIRVLREQIAHLNEGLADRDHVRARMEKLESAQDRVHQLEVELSDREAAHRGTLQQLERALAERDQRISEFDSLAAAQADEVRDTVETCRIAEQAQEVLKEEIRVLREHIAQLNEGLADHDRLRAQVAKLDSTQDRVHQLEVELSDREAAHRGMLQQLERALAERDKRIEKLTPITHLLREKESEIKEWESKFTRTVREHEGQVTKLEKQCATQDQLREQYRRAEQHLHERDEQIASLQRQLHDLETARQQLTTEVQRIPEKDEQLSRLRKRLREMQTELRTEATSSAKGSTIATANPIAKVAPGVHPAPSTKAAQPAVVPHQGRPNGAGQHFPVDQAKSSAASLTKAEPVTKTVSSAKAFTGSKAAPNTKPASKSQATSAADDSRQSRQNGAQQTSHVAQPKSGNGKDSRKDDLQKINGIGPAFAQTLNKLGMYTFIQIARWKSEDVEKISKKLETDPERIKREHWIADAKKQHYKKYGERL
ncbi:MAG: hypothetical protein Nkreftii_001937 [Candidatus Nitrospira kreftii]|uniref:Uncharacterized protein n=1 Tax=Candidatus Nitrospira kreftii TaxID=2652173 RepID=A0A7S8FE42_9BACT|nr:MAG: hypothetical protein Nkreftii_001937 [Candidatus Nitrospira kreftii]